MINQFAVSLGSGPPRWRSDSPPEPHSLRSPWYCSQRPTSARHRRRRRRKPFLAENDVAMKKMMNDMAVTPTSDVDADFVAMMVPHHQARSTWPSRASP